MNFHLVLDTMFCIFRPVSPAICLVTVQYVQIPKENKIVLSTWICVQLQVEF